jgi:type III restriction enzyme
MAILTLKRFQETAVDELTDATKLLLTNPTAERKRIVFQSPTGSGKTVMLAAYLKAVVNKGLCTEGVAYLWLSVGSAKLHEQSKRSVDKYVGNTLDVALFEDKYLKSHATHFTPNSVTVINWEKLRSFDEKEQKWANRAMRPADDYDNFLELIANTKRANTRLIVIVDESHLGSGALRTEDLHRLIAADITVFTSATPKEAPSKMDEKKRLGVHVLVDANDVVDEGLIKKDILINPQLKAFKDTEETTSEDLILGAAYAKRLELETLYRDTEGVPIKPLILIQIPNADAGDRKLKSVEKFLNEKNINESNGTLAVWVNDRPTTDAETIALTTSKVEALIFKQKVATGWDCPRANILVMFRDVRSPAFRIQTVGRIMRMPEQRHYKTDALNCGYVYVNTDEIKIEKEDFQPPVLRNLYAHKRKDLIDLNLASIYRGRIDFGVITSNFTTVFNDVMCKKLGIDVQQGLFTPLDNQALLQEQGFDLTKQFNSSNIGTDGRIKTEDLDTTTDVQLTKYTTRISKNDIHTAFETALTEKIQGKYALRDSLERLYISFYNWFKDYLGIGNETDGKIIVQHLILRAANRPKLMQYLSTAIETYEPIRLAALQEKAKRNTEKFDWTLPDMMSYDENDVDTVTSTCYAFDKCYLNKKRSQPEKTFEQYLETQSKQINWWHKNGDNGRAHLGIAYTEGEGDYTFYPDFIVVLNDGRIGIFDTKSGMTETEAKTKAKAESLQAYIVEKNASGAKLFGGIIVEKSGDVRLNKQLVFKTTAEAIEDWDFLNDEI